MKIDSSAPIPGKTKEKTQLQLDV